ncbi:MAG: L-threonylcarbamoyladenylate synthase [Treponema sp.]
MPILKKDHKSIPTIASALQQEQIVILPTDTIYGFSGIIEKTAEKIAAIKGRKPDKPFIALLAHPEDVYTYTDQNLPEKIIQLWPGPVSLIVPLRDGRTQAFRCPADPWLRAVIAETGTALYSTSVNYADHAPLHDITAIINTFQQHVAFIVDAGHLEGQPSTLIDTCGDVIRVIRQGSVPLALW